MKLPLSYFLFTGLLSVLCLNVYGQSTITITITEVSTTIPDCDLAFDGNSDPAWYWTGDIDDLCHETVCNGCTEVVSYEIFNETYVCANDVPPSISITFGGCENDGTICGGGTFEGICEGTPASRTDVINLPTTAGNTIRTFQANSTGCAGTWRYTLNINVSNTLFNVNTNVTEADPTLTASSSASSWQWLDCNDGYSAITGETGQAFTATDNGSYAVEVTGSGCIDTSNCVLITTLPIDLLSFKAKRNNSQVEFEWITVTETNNDYFTIERSADLNRWEVIKMIDGAGNSNEVREYKATDDAPLSGVSYYRLKQTDYDGEFSYSEVEVIDQFSIQQDISIFPNPTNDRITIEGSDINLTGINVLDLNGQNLTSKLVIFQKSQSTLELDLINLEPGIYFVMVGSGVYKVYRE